MKRYYANLLGKWTDITDEGTVYDRQKPADYFLNTDGLDAEMKKYGYINVQYGGKNYRIDPSQIQFVDE